MKIKSIINFATYLLLLSFFAAQAIAGCHPPCGPCYECVVDDCVWVGCDPPCTACEICNDVCGCEDKCDPDEICCGGKCYEPCGDEEQNLCDPERHIDCFPCRNLPWLCNNTYEFVFTGNPSYICWGGCPGDCRPVADVHCSTRYNCVVVREDYCAWCEYDPAVEDYGCVDYLIGWSCYECGRDPTDEGIKYYIPSNRCK